MLSLVPGCNDGFNFVVKKKKEANFETAIQSKRGARNLKVSFDVEFKTEEDKERYASMHNSIGERARLAVGRRSFKELQGPNGMKLIKGDIRREVESVMGAGTVTNIAVTEFLIE